MNLRNRRGVTMISLVVTVVVMIIVTTSIIYRTKSQVNLQKYDALQNDITAINNAVEEYYLKYGDIPVICEYVQARENLETIISNNYNKNGIKDTIELDSNDSGPYYVLNLGMLDNLTLNFGEDYKIINENSQNVTQYEDVYIINKASHRVYYPKCVESNDKLYYTDNIAQYLINTVEDKDVEGTTSILQSNFSRYYTEGKIDVVWLDTNNNVIENPNAPVLTVTNKSTNIGLTPVVYDASSTDCWSQANTSTEWYSYKAQTTKIGDSQTGTSKWANARANDGSLFVWIPRYAYKITYYNSKGKEIGYSTKKGIVDVRGNLIESTTNNVDLEEVKTVGYEDYIVHPAFTTNASNGGGWETELKGLWFGKFETSKNPEDTSAKVVAAVNSWTQQTSINQMYNYGLTATYGGSNESNILQSHMVKNSEWGVAVYLAYSKYGLNGGNIMRNVSTREDGKATYTGGSSDIRTVYSSTNICQSTTHNEYGIYDLNGGIFEYMAGYINNGNENLVNFGNTNLAYNLYDNGGKSTKYKTVYDGSQSRSDDYKSSGKMKGDAIFETSKDYTGLSSSWFLSPSGFPSEERAFFIRGGHFKKNDPSGYFCFGTADGAGYLNTGFRVCLAII